MRAVKCFVTMLLSILFGTTKGLVYVHSELQYYRSTRKNMLEPCYAQIMPGNEDQEEGGGQDDGKNNSPNKDFAVADEEQGEVSKK